MINLNVINKDDDPLKRRVEKQTEKEEFSPMDPPDAYAPPNLETVPYEDMHLFLQKLLDEHKALIKRLDAFEEILIDMQSNSINKPAFSQLRDFFEFFDQTVVEHHQKEEKTIFPLLHKRLKESDEHGKGTDVLTAIDMMEDDHIKSLQLAAVVFNFFGIATKLPNPDSQLIVFDTAIEQSKVLIELLRLHIFREDNIVFPLANQHITPSEFDNFS
ncbi:MAG: hemerythrin domain-containing protein [Bacteroidetes bacterium]|nr:hemerythrin domain-containing protein [Bacteroidota bacterium]